MASRDNFYPVSITFLVIDSLALGLRFWARATKKAIGYDDITMAISLLGFIIFCAMELTAATYGIGAKSIEPGFDTVKAAMFFTVSSIVYILTTGITKVGVALVLLRLSKGSDMRAVRLALIVSIAIVAIFGIVSALVYAFQCRPLSAAWGIGTGTCVSTSTLGRAGIALLVMDMTMSWFYALLPIYMLRKTQLPTKLKVSVLVLLGLGGVSYIATIIRFKYVIEVLQLPPTKGGGVANPKIVEMTVKGVLYCIIENGLSIFAASLTALRPLLKKVPCFTNISSGSGSGSRQLGVANASPHPAQGEGPAYQLDDRRVPDGGESQENLISRQLRNNIYKHTRIELTYTTEDPGPAIRPDREP